MGSGKTQVLALCRLFWAATLESSLAKMADVRCTICVMSCHNPVENPLHLTAKYNGCS